MHGQNHIKIIVYFICTCLLLFLFGSHNTHSTVNLRYQLRTNGIFDCVYVIIFQYFTLHDDACLKKPKHVAMKYTVN